MAYDFPGNVRELKNIIERSVALCRGELIAEENLLGLPISPDPAVSTVLNLKDACDEFERNYVRGALKAAGGNQSKAAQILGVARTTLSSKIEALGV
jgi:transcriptional regulator with PAS, ATPase and Fis domain